MPVPIVVFRPCLGDRAEQSGSRAWAISAAHVLDGSVTAGSRGTDVFLDRADALEVAGISG